MLPSRLQTLDEMLRSTRETERIESIAELAESRHPFALELLLRVSGDRDDRLSNDARRAFATSVSARPEVALRHSAADVRRAALVEVQLLQDTDAVGEVARILRNDANESLRETAALTIGRLGTDAGVRALAAAREDRSAVVRRGALNGLCRIGGALAQPEVAAFLSDPDWSVRQQAQGHLQDSGWTPTTRNESALWAIAQGRMDDAIEQGSDAVDPLVDVVLYVSDAEARQWAVVALTQVRSDGIVQRLELALDSPEESVAAHARQALSVIKPTARKAESADEPAAEKHAHVSNAFAAALAELALIGEP